MTRLLVLVVVVLVTSAIAQDAKITGNCWASDALIVSGTLSNSNGWPVEFVGFDKDQKVVTRNDYYTTQPDGTFQAKLSDPKKEIKFVKVEFVSAASPSARTRDTQPESTNAPVATVHSLKFFCGHIRRRNCFGNSHCCRMPRWKIHSQYHFQPDPDLTAADSERIGTVRIDVG
jgi:hypothetical protein